MKNDFYVYEWFNVDTDEVFYVGKGRNGRYKNTSQRNSYFKNYYNKHKCDVRKIKEHLEEKEAFELEIELIKKYRTLNQCQCNLTDGGEGSTFPEGSWNDIFRKLQYLYKWGKFSIMENEEDYDPHNLKQKSLEELLSLYKDYYQEKESRYIESAFLLKILDVYDDEGNLNIGWECFED